MKVDRFIKFFKGIDLTGKKHSKLKLNPEMEIEQFIKFIRKIDLTRNKYSKLQLKSIISVLENNIKLESTREFRDTFGPRHASNILNYLGYDLCLLERGRKGVLEKYSYYVLKPRRKAKFIHR